MDDKENVHPLHNQPSAERDAHVADPAVLARREAPRVALGDVTHLFTISPEDGEEDRDQQGDSEESLGIQGILSRTRVRPRPRTHDIVDAVNVR